MSHRQSPPHSSLPRVPVTVLTGFLGSGKTTLLNQLLRHPEMRDTAVIVNELGEIGLDHLLIVGAEENLVLLNAGCLCCAMLGSFKETLADLWHRRARGELAAFARVVVETTGLADPTTIVQSLLRDPLLKSYYELGAVIATLDAVLGDGELDAHPEAVKQAALADHIVITKTDLTGGVCPPALRSRLTCLNPHATISEISADISPVELLRRAPSPAEHFCALEASEGTGHDAGIRAVSYVIDPPVTWAGVGCWIDFACEFFGSRLLRCKGLLKVVGDARPVLLQGAQKVFAPPARIAWPDDDRRSRLVCISQDLDPQILNASLRLFHAEPGTYRPASVQELLSNR